MAIQRVRVGAQMDEAVVMEYDYDDTTNKVTTVYYKNTTGLPCRFVIYQEPEHTQLYKRTLPANTNNTLSVNIPAGQHPTVPGPNMSVSLDCGFA